MVFLHHALITASGSTACPRPRDERNRGARLATMGPACRHASNRGAVTATREAIISSTAFPCPVRFLLLFAARKKKTTPATSFRRRRRVISIRSFVRRTTVVLSRPVPFRFQSSWPCGRLFFPP